MASGESEGYQFGQELCRGLLGRRQDVGKGTKERWKQGKWALRPTQPGLYWLPTVLMPKCPHLMVPTQQKLSWEWGWPKRDLSNSWPHAVEADPCFPASYLEHSCLPLPPWPCQSLVHTMEKPRCSRHGRGLHVTCPLLPKVYRAEFIARWMELQLDVVLCPVLGPAFNPGYAGKLLSESGAFLGG